MNRWLGAMQRDILSTVYLQPEGLISLHRLKGHLYGWTPGRRLQCSSSQASNVSRSLAGIETRGLVRTWIEWSGGRSFRFIRITRKGRRVARDMLDQAGSRRLGVSVP